MKKLILIGVVMLLMVSLAYSQGETNCLYCDGQIGVDMVNDDFCGTWNKTVWRNTSDLSIDTAGGDCWVSWTAQSRGFVTNSKYGFIQDEIIMIINQTGGTRGLSGCHVNSTDFDGDMGAKFGNTIGGIGNQVAWERYYAYANDTLYDASLPFGDSVLQEDQYTYVYRLKGEGKGIEVWQNNQTKTGQHWGLIKNETNGLNQTCYFGAWIDGAVGALKVYNIRLMNLTDPPIPGYSATILTPAAGEGFNYAIPWLNWTVTDPVNWAAYSLDGIANVTIPGLNNVSLGSGLSEGKHNITLSVTRTSDSLNYTTPYRYFYIDTTDPAIISDMRNNRTISWNGTLAAQINFTDEREIYSVNITYSNGSSLDYVFGIGTATYSYNISADSGILLSDYITVEVCDAHTDKKIDAVDEVEYFLGGLKYKEKGNDYVTIYPKDYTNYKKAETKLLDDRYTFKFNKDVIPSYAEVFIIESSHKIDISPLQYYGGHLIIGGLRYWIDFENDEATEYSIHRVNYNKVEVTVYGLTSKNIKFNSIGKLNCIEDKLYFANLNTAVGYTSKVIERTYNTIYLNITRDIDFMPGPINASFVYNFTTYRAGTPNNFFVNVKSPGIPSVADNITGYWVIWINGTKYTLVDKSISQQVSIIGLDNCTVPAFDTKTLNISLKNASGKDKYILADNINYVFSWLSGDVARNYTGNYYIGNQTFCIVPNWVGIIPTNILFDYTVGGTTYEYSAYNFPLTNVTQSLILYATADTTLITLTVKDTYDDVVADAYIQVLKYDTSTATYSVVEIVTTNDEGEAVANLVLYNAWYKFIISYQGTTYLTTESTKIFSTEKQFIIDLTGGDWFDNYDIAYGVGTSLTFSNATKRFTFTWSDTTSAMHKGCLRVERLAPMGNILLNTTCVESAASTITYTLGGSVDGKTYVANSYFEFDDILPSDTISITYPGASAFFNKVGGKEIGLFVSWFFSTSLVMAGIWHPSVALLLFMIALFSTYALQLWTIGVPWFVGLIVLGIIILVKMRKL